LSQHPSPYPTPELSPDELLRPARRAGALMIALGVLFVSGGLCYAFMSFLLRSPDLMATPQGQELQQRLEEMESKAGGSGSVTRNIVVQGAVMLGIGAALGALGMVVRGGRRRPMIASIVVCGILAVLVGLSTLGTLLGGAVFGMAAGEVLSGVCIGTVVLCLLALLLVWLIQALRGEGRLAYTRQQYEAQLAYYQQQQLHYQRPPQQQPAPPPAAPLPPAVFQPQPPASAGGYHQYPTAPPPVSPAPSTTPTTTTHPGDSPDGPAAQG
jgi:hypothetical protein